VSEGLLLPPFENDPASAPFYEGTRERELRVQRCPDSGRLIFPPRTRSPYGSHRTPEWTAVSGRGSIWSFVVAHPPLLPAYASRAPYNVVAVALEEDPTVRLVGNLVAREGAPIDSVDPETIEIGAPVRVVFDEVAEGVVLPRWVLDPGV
jgi:uncharacterized OB-fold protein